MHLTFIHVSRDRGCKSKACAGDRRAFFPRGKGKQCPPGDRASCNHGGAVIASLREPPQGGQKTESRSCLDSHTQYGNRAAERAASPTRLPVLEPLRKGGWPQSLSLRQFIDCAARALDLEVEPLQALASILPSGTSRRGRAQRLIEILKNVVDVFDADTEPDRLGADAGAPLLLGRSSGDAWSRPDDSRASACRRC